MIFAKTRGDIISKTTVLRVIGIRSSLASTPMGVSIAGVLCCHRLCVAQLLLRTTAKAEHVVPSLKHNCGIWATQSLLHAPPGHILPSSGNGTNIAESRTPLGSLIIIIPRGPCVALLPVSTVLPRISRMIYLLGVRSERG